MGGAHGCRGRRGRHGGPGADRRFSADARRGRAGRVGSAYGYGILPDHDTGLWCNATPEMLRAGAMAYFSQGAACTYLFNYDCQRLHGLGKPYSHGELQALREIGDAAALARLNKRHTVTVDGSASVEEGAAQEPPDLLRMGRNELTITVTKRREDADPLLITGIEVLINNDGGE
ncbi:MAG: hypothetical protein OXJ90_16805 [Spirochaetaceae bacterium]|nr:hypothetical protein [Spirochaetaceae bacterium]